MLTKRLFLGALLLTVFVITGCTTTSKSDDLSSSQYRSVDDKCIKLGYKRGTDDYNRCIVILLGADKRTFASERENVNETVQESAKVEPENIVATEDQEIECRWMSFTGSRLKSKVCATKAEWKRRDIKHGKNVDAYMREIDRASRMYAPVAADPMGGQSGGVPH